MRLLVTRPDPDGEATATRLRALGHEVTVELLLRVVFAPPPPDVAGPAVLLVTSRNGVRALAGWPQVPGWLDTPLLAVGDATATAARVAGFTAVTSAGGDAVALAELAKGRLRPGGGPVLYVTANDRAGDLATVLRDAGHDLRVIEAYRTEKAESFSSAVAMALANGGFDGALFYSRRTAEAFRDLVVHGPLRLPHVFALSASVAEPLATLGSSVHVATAPDEAHLFALLSRV